MESWRQQPVVFWTFVLPGGLWLLLFFLVPLALIWILSFGERSGPAEIVITGTLDNYRKALDPLYLGLFWKSFWIAGARDGPGPGRGLSGGARGELRPGARQAAAAAAGDPAVLDQPSDPHLRHDRGAADPRLRQLRARRPLGSGERRSRCARARPAAALSAAGAALQQRRGRDRHRLRLSAVHGPAALRHARAPRPVLSGGQPRPRRGPAGGPSSRSSCRSPDPASSRA